MSYSASLTMWSFQKVVSYVDVVDALLQSGWKAGNGNDEGSMGARHHVENEETRYYSWPAELFSEALDILARIERGNGWFAFDISWPGEQLISIAVFSDMQRKNISFRLSSRTRMLDAVPSHADYNWYLQHLLPPVEAMGYWIDAIEFRESM